MGGGLRAVRTVCPSQLRATARCHLPQCPCCAGVLGTETLALSPQILIRLSKLCVQEGASGRKSRKQQQRLLRNMSAHAVVLELLQIPYEKVGLGPPRPRAQGRPRLHLGAGVLPLSVHSGWALSGVRSSLLPEAGGEKGGSIWRIPG